MMQTKFKCYMENVFNYKKILEILWNKYFTATIDFDRSSRDLRFKEDDYM